MSGTADTAPPMPAPGSAASVDTVLAQGNAALLRGELTDALACLAQVLALDPTRVDVLNNCGGVHGLLGQHEEALSCFQRALALDLQSAEVLRNLGVTLGKLGRHPEAIPYLSRAVELRPSYVDALCALGTSLIQARRCEEALPHLEQALELRPEDVVALIGRGAALDRMMQHEAALACFDRALALEPGRLDARLDRAAVLLKLHRTGESQQIVADILDSQPDNIPALNLQAVIYLELNRDTQARACLARVLEASPGDIWALNNLSYVELAAGDLVPGFRHFESRWHNEELAPHAYRGGAPLWLGAQSLTGKTILLHHEQGLGDSLQFIRYAPLVAHRGARVILTVPPVLQELLRQVPGVSVVLTSGDPIPSHDFHCPLMSLPLAFATTLDSIPCNVPYLQADPVRIEAWRKRLGPKTRPRVGIVWAGRQHPPINIPRDMSLQLLLPLLGLEADFFSLQKDVPEADVALLQSLPGLKRLGEAVESFADSAALMAHMDLVITVDTAAAHLAAALGKQVWLMNRFASCWRWLRDGRTDSPWYPTVRLFRQPSLGDWASVVEEVAAALEAFVKSWRAPAAGAAPVAGASSPAASIATLRAQGQAALARRDLRSALGFFLQVLGREPPQVDLLNDCGAIHGLLGEDEQAVELFHRALTLDPQRADVLNNLGLALGELGRHQEAIAHLTQAVALRPGYFDALCNLGRSLLEMRRYEDALASLDQALAIDADHVSTLFNRGIALVRLSRLEEARQTLRQVLQSQPDHVDALALHGGILWELNRSAEARVCLSHALAFDPHHVNAIHNMAFVELAEGNLLAGFRHHEIRWQTQTLQGYMTTLRSEAPLWLGEQSLAGKTIVLHYEAGLGDMLQFIRYVPLVAQRGARVVLHIQPPLRELLAGVTGVSAVISDGEPVPPHDFHCPMMSLPLAFGTTLASIPCHVPYVQADPVGVEAWRKRLGPKTRPRIGIVWTGRQYPPRVIERDMPLQQLLPLLGVEAQFISLQKDVPQADAALLGSLPKLLRLGESLESFADTAALVAHLDLLISVDTAAAHLAAAMGVPVWLLNRFASCWRWLRDGRTDSPWYPTVRIFRQPSLGDWPRVVMEVSAALDRFVQQWTVRPAADPAPLPAAAPRSQSNPLVAPTGVDHAPATPPGGPDLLCRRARGLAQLKQHESALQGYQQVLALEARHSGALTGGGAALLALQRFPEALAWLERALEAAPDDPEALLQRGAVLERLLRHEEALESFDRLLAQAPAHFYGWLNRAKMLYRLHRPHDALEASQQALAIRPDSVTALNLKGAILAALNRNGESRACVERALALDPGFVHAISNLGFLELAEGDLIQGFRHKEARWQTGEVLGPTFRSEAPLWLGEQSLAGRTVLLYAEQGLGDTLQFARYAPLVARRGATVILRVQQPLRGLLASLPGVSAVLGDEEPVPPHDLKCPLVSLPLAFATTLTSIPQEVPYVQADPRAIEAWRRRLGPAVRPRIGLVWAGRQQPPVNIPRDMRLQQLLPLLLGLHADFISVQKDVPQADVALLGSLPGLMRLGETLESFTDTAALVANLDLLITVDTSAAHLAGAMGKLAWIMNRFASCWRWQRDGRTDSPWYPTVRLFRQPSFGDWDAVVSDVRAALESFIAQWVPPDTPVASALSVSGDLLRRVSSRARQGDFSGAVACCVEALRADPGHSAAVAALSELGTALGQSGNHAQALACFEQALAVSPNSPELLCHQAVALTALKQHEPALACFEQVLSLHAEHVGALAGGGTVLLTVGRLAQALEWLERALRLDPDHAGALSNRAVALARLGRRGDALASLERAVGRDPAPIELLSLRGLMLLEEHRAAEALTCFEQLAARAPANLDALNKQALALLQLARHQEALGRLARLLEVCPDHADSLILRGVILDKEQRHEEALVDFDRVLAQEPGNFVAQLNRATMLLRLHRREESLHAVGQALRQHPDNVEALVVRGAALWGLKRDAEARAALTRALALQPDHANAANNMSFIELGEGDLLQGFRHHLARWRTEAFAGYAANFTRLSPLWTGEQSVMGKTLLLPHEQGLGDTLQFVRYASLVAQRGARVILLVEPSLKDLLASVAGVSAVISDSDPLPPHDFHCPLMSLPVAFATTLTSIPKQVPYVQADPRRVEAWRERLGPAVRPRIGLVWAGRQYPPINIPRDMRLQQLLPLLGLDANFISVQKEVPQADVALLDSLPGLVRLGETLESFTDTAALLANLDLLITVDTSAAHLAGALGTRVWIMNRFASCWRWMRDGRTDSPWYPTVRLFHQPSLGDWGPVVQDVREALEVFVQQW